MRGWVLITRPQHEARQLAEALVASEMNLLGYPVLREVSAADEDAWRHVGLCRERISVLFVTSPRAPRHFRQTSEQRALWPELGLLPADAVGAATAAACREIGLKVRIVGAAGAVSLAGEVVRGLRPGEVVLHPTGRHHREEANAVFAAAGATILPLVVYDMEECEPHLLPRLPETPPAAVLLTSPRAAAAYLRGAPPRVLAAPHFALGATTAEAAARLGLESRILPHPDPLLLVEELCQT